MKTKYIIFGGLLLLGNIHALYGMGDIIPSSRWQKNKPAKLNKNQSKVKPQTVAAQKNKYHLKSFSELYKTSEFEKMPLELKEYIVNLINQEVTKRYPVQIIHPDNPIQKK